MGSFTFLLSCLVEFQHYGFVLSYYISFGYVCLSYPRSLFFSNKKQKMSRYEWEKGGYLGGGEGGKTVLIFYWMRKEILFNKKGFFFKLRSRELLPWVVVAVQIWGPEFYTQHLYKILGLVIPLVIPETGRKRPVDLFCSLASKPTPIF